MEETNLEIKVRSFLVFQGDLRGKPSLAPEDDSKSFFGRRQSCFVSLLSIPFLRCLPLASRNPRIVRWPHPVARIQIFILRCLPFMSRDAQLDPQSKHRNPLRRCSVRDTIPSCLEALRPPPSLPCSPPQLPASPLPRPPPPPPSSLAPLTVL